MLACLGLTHMATKRWVRFRPRLGFERKYWRNQISLEISPLVTGPVQGYRAPADLPPGACGFRTFKDYSVAVVAQATGANLIQVSILFFCYCFCFLLLLHRFLGLGCLNQGSRWF